MPKSIPLSQILRLYKNKQMSAKQVAEHLGVTRQTISERLKKAGVPRRPVQPWATYPDRKLIEGLYLGEKLSIEKIADRLDDSKQRITRAIDLYGIPRRRYRPTQSRLEEPALPVPLKCRCDRYTNLNAHPRREHAPSHPHRLKYSTEGKIEMTETAERLNVPGCRIIKAMKWYGIKRRKPGGVSTPKFPQLRKIPVGDSLILPITAGNKYVSCYAMAKKAGIRVSVHTIDDKAVRVTRIA